MEMSVAPHLWTAIPPSFFWAFAGSLAVEIMAVYTSLTMTATVPAHYKQISFWVIRFMVASIGGGLAVAYGIGDNSLLAANIGASTPAIIHSFQGGLSRNSNSSL